MAFVKDLMLTGACKVLSESLFGILSKGLSEDLTYFYQIRLNSQRSGGAQQSQAREVKEVP